MEKELYDAVSRGDLTTFQQLIQQDPYLVHTDSFPCSRNLLHIATMHKKLDIVEEVLKINPRLAREIDSQRASPLHIAAEQGSLQIARRLLSVAPEACWWRDCHDMNPIYIAAINGHDAVLEEMLRYDTFPAMERVHRGQTVLHLCVKHCRLNTLECLVGKFRELVYAEDDDGETILHWAVRCKYLLILRSLVENNTIEKDTPNSRGNTALQILEESTITTDYSMMRKLLMSLSNQSRLHTLPKLTDMAMVVVVLIATMAFQATVSPPGGVWQDDTPSHRAGDAVMASTHPRIYKHFVRANAMAFVCSLVAIFLITTRMPSGRIHFLLIAVLAMWTSMAAIAVSYGASAMVVTPGTETWSPLRVIVEVAAASLGIIGFILACNGVRRLYLSWKSHKRRRQPFRIPRAVEVVFQMVEKMEKLTASESYLLSGLLVRVSNR